MTGTTKMLPKRRALTFHDARTKNEDIPHHDMQQRVHGQKSDYLRVL